MQPNHYTKLSEEELSDPWLAVHGFFDYSRIDRIKENMWEWLKITVSGMYSSHLLSKGQRYDMVYLYEHLEKLIEAIYILYRQHQTSSAAVENSKTTNDKPSP